MIGRRLLSSVRVRIVVIALMVVGVAFAVGGGAIVWQLHRSAQNSVADLTVSEASDVGSLVSRGALPGRFTAEHPGTEVQVVDGQGRVVGATPGLAGRGPISNLRPAPGQEVRFDHTGLLGGDNDTDVATALGVHTPVGPSVVYVVGTTDAAERAARNSVLPLVAVLFGLLVVTGIVAWVLVDRALRPVERIRSQVATISGGDLHQRVDEPRVEDEVGRLARTMNAMLARIEASADRQRQFVADASHELRSPLASLLAELEVARRHPQAADWPAVAEAAVSDGVRLQRIVDDLLLLARADEDHLVPRQDSVDLDELALEEGERVRERARVVVDLRGVGAARVTGDAELLRRLVRNLAENAERYATTTVGLEVRRQAGWAELVVVDDGDGIPPDKREWVFERFARLDDGRGRKSGGTGLGLAIVGEIARAHHGSVRVADSAAGTRMVVRVPCEDDGAGDPSSSSPDLGGAELALGETPTPDDAVVGPDEERSVVAAGRSPRARNREGLPDS